MSQPATAPIDPRFLHQDKQSPVRNTLDAGVLLVLNALDNLREPRLAGDPEPEIQIRYDIACGSLLVADNGPGVPYGEMVKRFATLGLCTDSELHRGQFTRGTKAVSALGTMEFFSLHRDQGPDQPAHAAILRFHPNNTHHFEERNQEYKDAERIIDAKTSPTGLSVKLENIPRKQCSSTKAFRDLMKHSALRGAVSAHVQKVTLVLIHPSGPGPMTQRIPLETGFGVTGPVLLDTIITLQGGLKSRLRLHQIPANKADRFDQFQSHGILIQSRNQAAESRTPGATGPTTMANHELTLVHTDIAGHSQINRVAGTLQADWVPELLQRWLDREDPTCVFDTTDHGIIGHLNRKHPVVMRLFSVLNRLLRHTLEFLREREERPRGSRARALVTERGDGEVPLEPWDLTSLLTTFPAIRKMRSAARLFLGTGWTLSYMIPFIEHISVPKEEAGAGNKEVVKPLIDMQAILAQTQRSRLRRQQSTDHLSPEIQSIIVELAPVPGDAEVEHSWSIQPSPVSTLKLRIQGPRALLERKDETFIPIVTNELVRFLVWQTVASSTKHLSSVDLVRVSRRVEEEWTCRLCLAIGLLWRSGSEGASGDLAGDSPVVGEMPIRK